MSAVQASNDASILPLNHVMQGYGKTAANFAATQSIPFGFKLLAYPVERIRLLMQTQHTNKTFESSSFSSLRHTASHMKTEGMLSPWRGCTPTIIRWFPSQYLVLFLKDSISDVFPTYNKKTEYTKYFCSKVGSGAATGVINAIVWAYPLDVVRQQLATKNALTWRNAVTSIYQRHGLQGFYRGFVMDAPGLMLFRGVQLGGWDLVKDHYGNAWEEKTRINRFAHGQVISLMGSVVAYPWDTVRRNLISMDVKGSSYSEVYRTGVSTAGGLRKFFYAGFSARVLSSVVNGALLEAFDEWKRTSRAA
ncbi:hypothetical protein DIPPA_15508 [Diplonema papillatum]|nr:hypothetical protein DIPPA_15508 [Diplonema papillatum]